MRLYIRELRSLFGYSYAKPNSPYKNLEISKSKIYNFLSLLKWTEFPYRLVQRNFLTPTRISQSPAMYTTMERSDQYSFKYSPLLFKASTNTPDNGRYVEYLHKVLPPYPLIFCGAILPLSPLQYGTRHIYMVLGF